MTLSGPCRRATTASSARGPFPPRRAGASCRPDSGDLRPAPFLILDEPTASLDEESERRISRALSRLSSGKTVLIIAHRLQTVRSADLILVLEDGRVVEQGRHEALAAQGGRYAALMAAGNSCRCRGNGNEAALALFCSIAPIGAGLPWGR